MVVVLQSLLQVLHSEQLLSRLLAEMLIGEVRGEGRSSYKFAQNGVILQSAVANNCLI